MVNGNGSNGGRGNGSAPERPLATVTPKVRAGPAQIAALEKLERDCIKIIDVLNELVRAGEDQSLRTIAERSGLSKDEVNRYLNPHVNELYNYERLLHVRGRNRPLYNHLIVSGPPKVGDDGKWSGIMANTSKYVLFKAMAQRFGYEVKYLGARGQIIDLEYRGIQNIAVERMGKTFTSHEPVINIDEFR